MTRANFECTSLVLKEFKVFRFWMKCIMSFIINIGSILDRYKWYRFQDVQKILRISFELKSSSSTAFPASDLGQTWCSESLPQEDSQERFRRGQDLRGGYIQESSLLPALFSWLMIKLGRGHVWRGHTHIVTTSLANYVSSHWIFVDFASDLLDSQSEWRSLKLPGEILENLNKKLFHSL